MKEQLQEGGALLLVDVQEDFVSGSLAVAGADVVVAQAAKLQSLFQQAGKPVIVTGCRHPADHCSFAEQGGKWPPHCVEGSPGMAIVVPATRTPWTAVIWKGKLAHKDAYSAFDGTELDLLLTEANVYRLFVGGLATDYCVKETVLDALRFGYEAIVLQDAIAAVSETDGNEALGVMRAAGATVQESGL